LKDIADEERIHAGESLRLLKELEPDEEKFYAEGAQEVEEEIKKLSNNSLYLFNRRSRGSAPW
jgi:rubrerythrin